MIRHILQIVIILLASLFLAEVTTALTITSVDSPDIFPGGDAIIRISIENTFNQNIEDVSFSLNFQNVPISPVGGSEDLISELKSDERDAFQFKIRSSPSASPGDYKIPYTLSYKGADNPRPGTINVRIKGNAELLSALSAERPVVGREDKITLKIINKGFANARYVSIKILPLGLNLHSEDSIYIGDIISNDFETATFDVKYTSLYPSLEVLIEYLDFNNEKKTIIAYENIKVYSKKEAINEGIIKENNAYRYFLAIVIIIIVFFIWRIIKRRIRKKKSMQKELSA